MPITYDSIATTTLTGSQSSITFASIPQTYTDLVLICIMLPTASTSAAFQFNNDTASNYSYTVLDGDGATASSARQLNVTGIQLAGWSSNMVSTTNPSMAILNVSQYTNTGVFKSALVRSSAQGTSGSCVDAFAGTWRSAAAITQIRINANSFAAGSVFTLYGIKAA